MFELARIDHRYGPESVVRIASWRAAPGDQWLLAGPSGSGKTTLLHILAGLVVASAGHVIVGGTDLSKLGSGARDRWRGRTVGLVPQRLHLVAALDVATNLVLAQHLAHLPVDRERIRALLEAVGIGDLAHRYPRTLSQGQAQRVAIARAAINRPALLLADEPTANLDDVHAAAALELLRGQAIATGATLVVASHDARVRPLFPNTFALTPHAGAARAAA